jgi:hypothetical protein
VTKRRSVVTTRVEDQERQSQEADERRSEGGVVGLAEAAVIDGGAKVSIGRDWTGAPAQQKLRLLLPRRGSGRRFTWIDDLIRAFAWAKILGG